MTARQLKQARTRDLNDQEYRDVEYDGVYFRSYYRDDKACYIPDTRPTVWDKFKRAVYELACFLIVMGGGISIVALFLFIIFTK